MLIPCLYVLIVVIFIHKRREWFLLTTTILFFLNGGAGLPCYILSTQSPEDDYPAVALLIASLFFGAMAHWVFSV